MDMTVLCRTLRASRARTHSSGPLRALCAAAFLCAPQNLAAQALSTPPILVDSAASQLDSLVRRAREANPDVIAARHRVTVMEARVAPAAAPSDPILMFGVANQPLGRMPNSMRTGGPAEMTMKMLGVAQSIPYPGKLSLRRSVAESEVAESKAALDAVTLQAVRDVKDAYFELAFIDEALAIIDRNRDVLSGFIRMTEVRYSLGVADQSDLLKAQLEATRLAESAAVLIENRRGALAQLNAIVDRPSDTPIQGPHVPLVLAQTAVGNDARAIDFTSPALGARASNSPLPGTGILQARAAVESPEIAKIEAMIATQSARIEVASHDHLPDLNVSLQYGQRSGGLPDMLTALVSVPVPVFKGRKQDEVTAEARAQLLEMRSQQRAKENEINAEVARLASQVERSRTQLALYVKALLPQARAALSSAVASYQVGKIQFLSVLESQTTLFSYESEYFRELSDFAKNVAELERIVGGDIIR